MKDLIVKTTVSLTELRRAAGVCISRLQGLRGKGAAGVIAVQNDAKKGEEVAYLVAPDLFWALWMGGEDTDALMRTVRLSSPDRHHWLVASWQEKVWREDGSEQGRIATRWDVWVDHLKTSVVIDEMGEPYDVSFEVWAEPERRELLQRLCDRVRSGSTSEEPTSGHALRLGEPEHD